MEITKIIKEKIFSLYFGQKVMWQGNMVVALDKSWNWQHPSFYLVLKTISKITNDDVKLIGYPNKEFFLSCFKDTIELTQIETDLLRQLGYATDFTTIIEGKAHVFMIGDIVNAGIYKLIED